MRTGGMLGLILVLVVAESVSIAHANGLRYAYYSRTCPTAERIIADAVRSHFQSDNTIAAGLLRLHFHDCFVQGCDGSILLDSSIDGSVVERKAIRNNNSIRGFEIIDDIKTRLEASCPGVVSCADIVALAARDSVAISGGPFYGVPTGRLDGKISRASDADADLPTAIFTAAQLKANFNKKGLGVDDLVLLSGGHTLGRAKCAIFSDRLYNFSNTGGPDPSLSSSYLTILKSSCPQEAPSSGRDSGPTVALDKGSEFKFDNSYYNNLVNGNGLLKSDAVLKDDSQTKSLVSSFSANSDKFLWSFVGSMIKMGQIDLKTSENGEVRIKCNVYNSAGH
ncbi:hypothetical protein O6H91_08G119200 [Diphasiastrum complanatum]|nr:hypothetical protein O6H91_08G119200 [Diphasiastrum complanatum]